MTWANKNVRHEQSRYKVTQGGGGGKTIPQVLGREKHT